MEEKCPCQIYKKSCCACVSMHCDECHGHSKFVQGRFCSNCGRPLKAELTRLYVPKSEVERLQESNSSFQRTIVKFTAEIERLNAEMTRRQLPSYCQAVGEEEAIKIGKEYGRAEVARGIFEEIDELLSPYGTYIKTIDLEEYAKLKKKYTER